MAIVRMGFGNAQCLRSSPSNRDAGRGTMSFDDVWYVSAKARTDTRLAMENVYQRQVGGKKLVRDMPPEEVTTFNLVSRLAAARKRAGGTAVALHSRKLEGGVTSKVPGQSARKTIHTASGADLEMAIEVRPNQWVDLVLQAKRFSFSNNTYKGWSRVQNQNLIDWARANGNRTPGMLLYNPWGQPFPKSHAEFTDLFGACCRSPKTLAQGVRSNGLMPPTNLSPMGVSLVVDRTVMICKSNPTPEQIQKNALPLECVFCPCLQNNNCRAGIPTRTMPTWASSLAQVVGGEGSLADSRVSEVDADELYSGYSGNDDLGLDESRQGFRKSENTGDAETSMPAYDTERGVDWLEFTFSVVLGMSDREKNEFRYPDE